MSIFKKTSKAYGGLFIDKGLFRFIILKKNSEHIEVVKTTAATIPDQNHGNDPFDDYGKHLGSVFSYIRQLTGNITVPINIALPINDSLLRIVPDMDLSPEDTKQAFKYEYERYFPFTVEESTYDLQKIIYPLRDKGTEKRCLAMAARKVLVDNIMDTAESQHFKMIAIEPAQIALERAITPTIPISDACILLYAGITSSVFILSWKGNGIFYRVIPIGFGAQKSEFNAETAPDDAPQFAFTKLVHSSKQFAVSQIRGCDPDIVYLYGPGASIGLRNILKESIEVSDVLVSDPLNIHGISLNPSDIEMGLWNIPIGLALRFM